VSLFGYSSYQPSGGFVHDIKVSKSTAGQQCKLGVVGLVDRDHHLSTRGDVLPNPPPLLSDHKSSVIVKNEVSRDQHPKQSVAAPAHSPSPKMMSYLNVQSVAVSIIDPPAQY
jgi:lysine-specific demethylase 3